MGPDEQALRLDLGSPALKLGVRRGQWEFVRLQFPYIWFRIPAPPDRQGPCAFLFRVNVKGYPGPLTAQLWDARTNQPLAEALRPHGAMGLLPAFSSWGACLYHPVDRLARNHWPNLFDDLAWRPGHDICNFLETIHGLIHDPQYLRSTAPAEAAELPTEALVEPDQRAA